MDCSSEEFRKVTAEAMAQIPTVILKLIIVARDEDPDFWRYTSLREVVAAMNRNKDLKNRILKRLHDDENRYKLN